MPLAIKLQVIKAYDRISGITLSLFIQGGAPQLSAEDEALVKQFRENQAKAPRLPMGVEVRTLIDQSLCYGTLSTNSVQYSGFPTGSIVGFELDDAGKPFFVFSTMSAHTKDVQQDGKVSLTVTAKDFKGAAEGRVVLIGNMKKVDPTDTETITKLRAKYLSRHKEAYWIDFGSMPSISLSLSLFYPIISPGTSRTSRWTPSWQFVTSAASQWQAASLPKST